MSETAGEKIAHARDGSELRYSLTGDESAPRVVLIHSLALDRGVWDEVAARLGDRAHVLTYDCRGHGASAKVAGPYTVDLFAQDLEDVMTAAGWDAAVIAGASMGGSVALAFAAARPERTRGLALVDTTAYYGDGAVERWRQRATEARTQGLASLIEFQLSRWFSDAFRAAHPDVLERLRRVFVANDLDCYAASCAMLGALDLRAAARGVRAPTAVLVGEEDYATPLAMARELNDLIAGSTLRVLPGARHLTPLERPDDVARAIGALISA